MTEQIDGDLEMDLEVAIETPVQKVEKPRRTPFGWCLTGHHRNCRKTSADGKQHCTCDRCGDDHGVDYVPLDSALPADVQVVVDRYSL